MNIILLLFFLNCYRRRFYIFYWYILAWPQYCLWVLLIGNPESRPTPSFWCIYLGLENCLKLQIKVGILVFQTADFTRSAYRRDKWTDNKPFTKNVVIRGNCSNFGMSKIKRECKPFESDRLSRSGEELNTIWGDKDDKDD